MRQRSPRGEGAGLRDEIVAVGERLLLQAGNEDAVSIREIAKEVGVTPPSIYRHFADKAELMIAVCEKQFSDLNRLMQAAAEKAENELDELQARGETYIRFGLDHPEAYAVMFMRPSPVVLERESTLASKPGAFMALVDSVKRAMNAGFLNQGSADHAAQVIWSSVHGLTSLLIAMPTFPWSKQSKLINDVLLAAVSPFLPTSD